MRTCWLTMFFFGLSMISVRWLIFAAIWTILGRHFWIFPNLLSDEVSITDAFRPWYQWDEGKSKEEAPKVTILSRVIAIAAVGGLIWAMHAFGPDEKQRKTLKTKVSSSFERWLEWNPLSITENSTTSDGAGETIKTDQGHTAPGGEEIPVAPEATNLWEAEEEPEPDLEFDFDIDDSVPQADSGSAATSRQDYADVSDFASETVSKGEAQSLEQQADENVQQAFDPSQHDEL